MSKRKAPENEGPNEDFCQFLLEIADYEKNVARNIHKYNAYRAASGVLAQHPTRITSGKEAKELKGIGQKIADKIDEFIQTGKVKKLEKIRSDDDSQIITSLTRVTGIGPAAAKQLHDKGIASIEDLKKHEDWLNHHQKIGLKYYDDFEKKIPRAEMEKLERIINDGCKKLDKKYVVAVCGSYRRGASESGDIDILLTHTQYTSEDPKKPELLKNFVTYLEEIGLVKEQIACGDTKFMGVCLLEEKGKKYPFRRIDIRIFPHDQYFCATLYFTGSSVFNKTMRAHALEQGFTLNEYSLRPLGKTGTPGEPLPMSSEKDIFEYLDYPYKKPEERNM